MNLTAAQRRQVLEAPTAKERRAIFNRLRQADKEVVDEEAYWDAVIDGLGRFKKSSNGTGSA